jgi:asparagine synthase (glutamine-hydrolysing)
VRALLATGLVPRRLSHTALESYLSYGSVQQPLTIIENVFALLPGHSLTFTGGQVHTEPYWELSAATTSSVTNESVITEELSALLSEAVKLRLVSDVPVGVFLSGGIDSSALVSLMRRSTNSTIKSFSVTFSADEFNEGAYAQQIARQFNTEHQSVTVTESELLAKLPRALAALDQPAVDGFNTYIVSEAVAAAGLKVALSGAGGDEVFAGYQFFQRISQSERLRHQLLRIPPLARRAAAAAVSTLANSTRAHKLSSLLRSEHLSDHSVYLQRRLFTDEQQRMLLLENNGNTRSHDHRVLKMWSQRQAQTALSADVINQSSVLELGGYLSNTLLRDTDTMSMAHSLEVRVPLIDHRLVEFMLQVPGKLKVRAREPKRLLVNAVADLPHEIVHRPKRGFELPFKHWLRKELRTEVEREFNETPLKHLLRIPVLTALWDDFQQERLTWSRVWSLYVLSRWVGFNLA